MGDRLRAGKPSRYVTSHLGPGVGKSTTGLTGLGEGGVCSLVSGSRLNCVIPYDK